MNLGAITRLLAACMVAISLTFSVATAQPLDHGGAAAAQVVTPDRVMRTMGLHRLSAVLAAEIRASGDPLVPAVPRARDEPAADPEWDRIVARIAPVRGIQVGLAHGLAVRLATLDPRARAEIAEALGFWESPTGRRALALEYAAREMLLSPDAEVAARSDFAKAAELNDPRVDRVRKLVEAADLVEPGVAATLNMSMASMRGIGEVLSIPEDTLTADIWELEPEIRADQSGWIEALLFVSTSSMSPAEVEALIAHAETPGARLLSQMIEGAAGEVFDAVARDLGRAAAMRQGGSRL